MTITDKDLCEALERSSNALGELLTERQMEPSSLVRKHTFMIDGKDMSPNELDGVLSTIRIIGKSVGEEDFVKIAFYSSYQTHGDASHKTALQVYRLSSNTPLEGLTQEQSQTVLRELDGRAKTMREAIKENHEAENATGFFFFLLGRRYRQYVDDSLALADLSEKLDFDMDALMKDVDADE